MPKLIAIHEIHRVGKNGKPEVIAPGKPFTATAEEAELLVEQFGAARPSGDTQADDDDDEDSRAGAGDKPLADWTKAQLTARAAELGIEVPKNAKQPEIVALIEAKQAADLI